MNPHGTPIWYELVTPDANAAKTFYDAVIGWTVGDKPDGDMDYRMIATADGSFVGGLAAIGPAMPAVASKPGWRFYIGVDDVDASVAAITEAGGSLLLPAFDMEGVGRMAFVADPQGIAFYVMRGASDEDSTAFDRRTLGKAAWNELSTPDQAGANAFYQNLFGWTLPDAMPMGEMGEYRFIHHNGDAMRATMTRPADGPPANWQFYFRAPDIEEAAAKVTAGGGTVFHGPVDVPGGERIVIAADPQGIMFGVVAGGEPA